MKWYNKLQFLTLLLTMAVVPLSWKWGVLATLLVAVASLVKLIADHHIGNPSLTPALRLCIATPLIYWLVCALGLLYSTHTESALDVLGRKATLLIFPLCLLLTDTGYLRMQHLRTLFFSLVLASLALFAKGLITHNYEHVHHSYASLYVLTALAFLYAELSTHWRTLGLWHKSHLVALVAALTIYLVYANSRAGILCLYGIESLLVLKMFWHRRWAVGLLLAFLLLGGTWQCDHHLPGHHSRLATPTSLPSPTPSTPTSDHTTTDYLIDRYSNDARGPITRITLKIIAEQPFLGYGIGDYYAVCSQRYADEGYPDLRNRSLNAHNQYIETTLASGLLGLLSLLAFLLAPIYLSLRHKTHRTFIASLTFIVMFSLVFESMLERQMGLLFISPLFAIMALIISMSKNKFGQ